MKRRTWGRAGLAGLGALALFSAWVYGSTEARLRARYDVKIAPLSRRTTGDAISRGEHVAHALAKCTTCHGEDLGGRVIAESPLLGLLSAPNLSPASGVARSDEQLLRALLHGLKADGRPLVLMPSHEIAQLSDADLSAVIAYLRSVPPVARAVPPLRVGPLYRLLLAFQRVELPAERIDHSRARAAPEVDPASAQYGEYLSKTGGCYGCHGSTLAGGPIPGLPPGTPPAADIRPQALAAWSYDDFEHALRHGVRPDGRQLAEIMPWRAMSKLTDAEVKALYVYLKAEKSQKISRIEGNGAG